MFHSFDSRYRLCDLFGIPLYLDFSLIILLLLFALGGGSFHAGVVCAALLLLSITAHELGHSLTARAFGYPTRDITLSLLGGCASLIALPRKAWQEFLTAIAGPAVSFLLAIVGMLGVWLLSYSGGFGDAVGLVLSESLDSFGIRVDWGGDLYVRESTRAFVGVFAYLATMNMMLGIFNLFPGFPLDGGRVFRSAMTPVLGRVQATHVAMIVGRFVAVGIGLKGAWSLLHGGNWGFVTIMIAWMIWKEGWREYQLAKMESFWRFDDYRARVSPPPYGGDGDDCDVRRNG